MKIFPNSDPEENSAEDRLGVKRNFRKRKLKNYLVANSVQIKIAVSNLILMALVVFVMITLIISPFYHDIFSVDELYARHYSAKFFLVLLERSSFAILAIFFLLFLNNVLINHKVCGPLNNFSNTFKKMAVGDLSRRVRLRKYDFLKNEADQVNRVIDSLSRDIEQIKISNQKILECLENFPAADPGTTSFENALRVVKRHAADCGERLSRFKLEI